jgi:hypothetical protein
MMIFIALSVIAGIGIVTWLNAASPPETRNRNSGGDGPDLFDGDGGDGDD